MKQLLPSLQSFTSNEKSRTFFYFLRLEKLADGNILKRKFEGFGGKCLHWWECEYTFIGDGDEYWTHAAVFKFSSAEALTVAQKSGLSSNEVLDLQLFSADVSMPSKIVTLAFKMLRPIGWFYSKSNPKGTVDDIANTFQDEGGIVPRKDQIQRHLANQRASKAFMINLLQPYKKAQYGESEENSTISGGTAYFKKYSVTAMRSVLMMGGNLEFSAKLGAPLLEGNSPKATQGSWAGVAVMQYPNPSKLLALEHMPGYKSVLKHRRAGLERTALIVAK